MSTYSLLRITFWIKSDLEEKPQVEQGTVLGGKQFVERSGVENSVEALSSILSGKSGLIAKNVY